MKINYKELTVEHPDAFICQRQFTELVTWLYPDLVPPNCKPSTHESLKHPLIPVLKLPEMER